MNSNNIIRVSAGLLIHKDKFLVSKRAKGELKGKWEFPGGKIEPGESVADAIIREIYEELRLDVTPVQEIADFKHKYPFASIHLTLVQCSIRINSVINSDGTHDDFQWISIEDSSKFDFAPLDAKIINYLKHIKSRE